MVKMLISWSELDHRVQWTLFFFMDLTVFNLADYIFYWLLNNARCAWWEESDSKESILNNNQLHSNCPVFVFSIVFDSGICRSCIFIRLVSIEHQTSCPWSLWATLIMVLDEFDDQVWFNNFNSWRKHAHSGLTVIQVPQQSITEHDHSFKSSINLG
jgi:hypothetical protein